MALELESLLFRVESSQLDDARIKLAKLGDAVNALNKPMQDMTRISAKTNEVIAKSELAAEKARQAQKALAEEVQDTSEKMSRVEKNLQKVTTGLQIFRGETVNVKDASVNLGDSFTKSQANFLAMQMQLGATAEQLKSFAKEFIDFNKMTSTNTFDNSIRGLNKLKQETKELAEVDKLMRDGIALTKDQIVNLTRDSERLTQAYKSMKKTDEELSSALLKLREDTIEAAKAKNTFIEAAKQSEMQAKKEADAMLENARAAKLVNDKMMQDWSAAQGAKSPALQEMSNFYKEQERLLANGMTTMDQAVLKYRELEAARNKASSPRSISEQAAAEAYLAKETERVNRLIEAKGEITSSTNNRLIKYEQALKASGVSSEVAAAKLAKYKEQLLETQKVAGNRQMDYLSRALGPQITDIFVGLATGQNPMTVLLQQGGQLRDQFALAGVEGANMGKALTTAFASMYDSTKNVAIAVGTMLVDGFIKLGLAATTVVSKMTGDFYIVGKSTEFLIKNLSGLITLFPALETAIIGLGEAINFSIGAGVIALVVGLGVAFKQIIQEESALSRALLTTGAALGFSKQSAIEFAQSLDGVSESKVKNFLTELAKNSVENTGNLKELTKTAVDLEKYAGISLDETAKKYAELQKKPVDGLVKLATETGRVSVATLKHAEDLKEAKKYTELATLANEEFARSYKEVAAATEKDLSPIERIFKTISDEASSGWNAFKEWANTPEVLEVVKTAWTAFSVVLKTVVASVKQVITGIGSVISAIKNLAGLNFSAALDSVVSGYENVQKIGAEYTADVKNTLGGNYYGASNAAAGGMSTEQLAANARAAKAFEQQKKDREEARKKIESDAKKLENYYKKVLDAANNYHEKMIAGTEDLTQAEINLKQIENDPEWAKLSKDRQQKLKDIWIHNAEIERQNKLLAEQRKIDISTGEARNKLISDGLKEVESIQARVKEQEIALSLVEYENNLIGISQNQREYLVALKKEELEYEKKLADIKAKGHLVAQETDAIAALNREFELRKKSLSASSYQKQFDEIQSVLSGAIADALFEGGKKGADSLRNYLKTTFRKFVIDVFINPVVGSIMSSAASALGLNPSSSSTTGQLIGAAKTGSNVYSAVTGGFAKAGAYASMAFDKIAATKLGQQLGLSSNVNVGIKEIDAITGNVVSDSAVSSTQLTATGEKLSANIGQMTTSIAAAFVAQGLRKAISGGFKMNKGLEKIAGIANIAAGFAGPFTQIVTGVVSGIASRAFGTKLTQTGIQGTFGGTEGFTGSRYTFEKGGWFRRNKTRYQPLEEEIRTAMALSFAVTKSEVQKFSDYLGIGAEALSNFSYQIKVNLMGLSEDDAVKTMQEVFNQMKDAMAAAVLAGKNYTKEGETQYQTLERLATTVYTVNSMFKDFGASLLDTGFAGVDAALAYSEYFGGLDKLSSSLSSFYDTFYTDSEKVNNLSRNLTDAFSALGFEMPKTRDEFKKLVLSVIELGDPALLKDVLSLQDGFVSMTETAINSFKELTGGIQSEIDRLLGANLTSASSTIQGSAMRTEFDILSALARGGDATALAKLPEFSQAIEKNMTDFASSASDVIFARAMLAQSLSDTMSSLGGNTTVVPTSVSGLAESASIATTGAADLTTSVTSQSDLVSMLIAEIQGLRAEVRADVSANTKTSKILERANQDGESLSVTVLV